MMENRKIMVLLGLSLCSLVLMIIAHLASVKLKKRPKGFVRLKQKKGNKLYDQCYQLLSRHSITKAYTLRIRNELNRVDLSDQWELNRKVAKIFLLTVGFAIGLGAFLTYYETGIFIILVSIYCIYVVHQEIVKYFVNSMDNKLLIQFEGFISNVRHHYHQHGMIDEAIYDAIEDSDYDIALHGSRIYDILTDHDAEEKVEEYYDSVTNKFFKNFVALCHTIQVYGDQKIEGNYLFLTNLNYLKEEINLEVIRRKKLRYLFRSLNFIAIAPAFFLLPIEKWALGNMSELASYYKGAYGFVVELIIYLTIIIAFKMISRLQSTVNDYKGLSSFLEKRLLRIRHFKKIVNHMKFRNYSKTLEVEHLLRTLGLNITVEVFYLKKLIWMSISFVTCLIIFINVLYLQRQEVLHPGRLQQVFSEEVDYVTLDEMNEVESKYVRHFLGKSTRYSDIESILTKDKIYDESQAIAMASENIYKKLKRLENIYFRWWFLLIAIAMGWVGYKVPDWTVLFRKSIYLLSMEDEVVAYNTIILMLMYVKRISVEDILNHMVLFANVFKESIQKCLNNFEFGDDEALEQLRNDEPYLPFVRIVQKLQIASNDIPIVNAFDELKSDRNYYKDNRKLSNEMMIDKKGLIGKLIAFVPFTLTIALYLLVPFLHYSLNQFASYSNYMNHYIH